MQETDALPDGSAAVPGLTVVVPAYNAGSYLDRCMRSLLDQTLDRSRYDIIVVDDGSTDGTGEAIDRVAQQHPGFVRAEHIENSGWPGRPRNIGTDLSTREYVFYCDADDWLMPYALELMLDRAEADRADLVMARPIGNRRRIPMAIWEKGDRCTNWRETPGVFSNLTCQKLFRRQFLRERDVRFGEGKVRLEDFLFMTAAYLRAERITIIGSRPCYVFELRDDGGNITATRATEDDYFASVEKIIDIVLAEVPPGPEQDLALDRVVHSELIGPLSSAGLLRKTPEAQAEALGHARRLLRTKVPPSAVARLDAVMRNRAAAIERGDLGAILRRIERDESTTLSAVVDDVSWEGPKLRVRIALALQRDDEVVRLERDGDTLLLPREAADDDPVDVTRSFARTSSQVHVRHRERAEEWRVSAEVTPTPDDGPGRALSWTATVLIDVHTLAGGEPASTGVWDLIAVVGSCGYRRLARPRAAEGTDPDEPPTVEYQGLRVRPYWTQAGALAMTVRRADKPARGPRTETDVPKVEPAGSGPRRARTWRRRAVTLAAKAGLTVTDVGPGVVLLSRTAELDIAPLAKGRSWVVSKRRRGSAPPKPQKLGDAHWLVPAQGDPTDSLSVDTVGSRAWLVSRQDPSAMAPIYLENETMQQLAVRHMTWLLQRYDVDLVIDVGANTGQYAGGLRRNGYRGAIASFEPVPHFADAIDKQSANDPAWTVHRIALGSTEGTVPIRIQRTFSSLLPASEYGKGRFTTLREFADKDDQVVDVPLRRLEAMLPELLADVHRADGRPPRVFLKMDTQGFDLEVFRGLGDRQGDIVGLQSEVALLLIYEGMPRMPEAMAIYEQAGFELSGMYPVTTERDGRVIEYDCVMVRAGAAPALD